MSRLRVGDRSRSAGRLMKNRSFWSRKLSRLKPMSRRRIRTAMADDTSREAQITLYHRTSQESADQIMKDGFRDGVGHYLTENVYAGVWFSDRPLDSNEGAEGDTLLVIDTDMTDRELADFELVEEGKTYREWLIPAEVINPRIRSLQYSD